MNRAKLILSLAINEKLIPSKQAANILVDFTLHRKMNPRLRLEDHLFAKHIFSAIQIGNLLALFNMMRISCKNCQTKVDIANMPIAGNWLCPSCRHNEFGLIKVKKVSPDAGEPFAKNIPKTISDQSISQLYKTAPGDSKSPYINKTSVAPANNLRADAIPENIAEPIMLDADHSSDAIDRTLLTEDQAIDMTVSDGYLIQTDSFDIKDSSDFNHERVLISKNNVSIDSQNKVRIADDDNETSDDNESQLILDNELFTPADNAQTLLQARKSTEKLPSNFSGIANRTAINMDGQEVVHKGITPESLEKGLSEGAILDGFEIRGILGRGGMGIVYNGHDLALNRKVAIKVLSPNILQNETQLKRFEIEAQACAQLEHQNVVNIYRFGTIYNHPYIVMQFVDGMSLNDIIKEDGYLPIEQVLDYLMQTARGLQEAHHRNIIHRDIKPDNLLVDTRGTIKIVDFGLAKQTTSDAKLSQSGYFLGTPAYISPEQASGDPADHRADIYSLGISAFQMLTGKLPFNGTAAQVVTAHLIQELPDITELNEECPESLEAVIRKMTGKSPDERYQSMDEVIDSLEFVQKEVYGEIIVDYPKKRKPILLTVLIILVVLLIGAGVGLYFMGILDPIIAEITGKTAAITDDGTKPTSNGNGIKTTNGHETQNGNGNNGTHQKTPAEIAAEKLKLENEKKQKRFINEAQNIIGAITTGFWTDISGNVKRIDKEKFEEYEKQFLDLLKKIEDETDRFNLNSKFYVQKSICSEKWVSIAKDIAKEKLAEFIKKLQNLRTDTTTTLEDINDNLQKIDNFVIELPESASELDKFKIDLEKIKTNIEKLISLKEKSKDENDLQVLLNYLVVLGEIVNVDGKAYKFEDRDDVKGYKYALTRTFEDQMMKRYADIAKMAAKSELDTLQKLVDDYALLVILNPKEKEKYKFVTQSIETRRKEIERNEKIKELKERLIQQIDESLIEQDLEKMQSLRRQINRQEEDYPEIFDDKVFREWLNKLDDMVEHRKVEEEEFANVRAGIKKLTDRCNDIDIKDKSKIEDVRILKTDIDEYLEKNKELLENTKLKDEKTNLHDVRLKCIEYLSIHTVEIYNTDDNENIPWQLKKACSFKGALFNLRLEKIYSDFSWRQPAKITCMEYVKTRNAEYIITGSIDKTVRLWDYKTLTEVRILRNEAAVTALAYRISKNNEIKIFAGLKDGTIAVWNPIYSKVNNFSTIHTSAVTSIVVLNNIALSTSEDKTVVGWSYKDETLNLKGEVLEPEELNRTGITIKHPDVVFQVDVSADRNYFATACGDQKIRIYSMNGALKTTIKGFFGAVYSVSFEPTEGKLIAAGGEENAVKIFRIENGESFAEFKGHKHYITNVKYNSQGRLVSTSLDNKSILWNVEKQEPEIEYLSKLPNTDFVFTSDNQIIFSQWDGGFSKFRINNGQKIPNSNVGHTNSITGVFKTHNGEIITTSIDGKVLFWSNEEISKPTEFSLVMPSSADNGTKNEDKNNENIPITAFSADSSGKYGVFGRLDESVFLVDFTKKTVVKYWDLKENISSVGVILMQNDDSFEVVCIIGTKGGQVFVKSLNDTINKQFKVKGNTVSSINTTNTGLVAVAGYSSEVVIYNLHLKMIESTIDSSVSNSIVTSLDMSNDGNIAIGYKEQDMGVVRVYKIASKELVTTYSNLEISVVSLHFILNSTTILAIDGAANVKAFKINEDGSNLENFSANIGFCGDIITSTFINSDFGLIIFGTARGAVLSYKIETE